MVETWLRKAEPFPIYHSSKKLVSSVSCFKSFFFLIVIQLHILVHILLKKNRGKKTTYHSWFIAQRSYCTNQVLVKWHLCGRIVNTSQTKSSGDSVRGGVRCKITLRWWGDAVYEETKWAVGQLCVSDCLVCVSLCYSHCRPEQANKETFSACCHDCSIAILGHKAAVKGLVEGLLEISVVLMCFH